MGRRRTSVFTFGAGEPVKPTCKSKSNTTKAEKGERKRKRPLVFGRRCDEER